MTERRRISTHILLLALGAAILIPLLAFALIVLIQYANFETRRAEQLAEQLAVNIGLVVDAELNRGLAVLRGLAASNSLDSKDYARFHAEASRALAGTDSIILLRDLQATQILNSAVRFGTFLPPAVQLTEAELEEFRAGRPYVSNVYASPFSGETRYAVALPIKSNGQTQLLLSLTAPTTRLRDILQKATPSDWISALGDRRGFYIARSQRHEEVTGTPGVKAYLDKTVGKSGSFRELNQFGLDLLAGYTHSDLSGWLIAANVPQSVVSAPFRRSMKIIGAGGALTLLVSLFAAYVIGRAFTATTAQLSEQASALGDGRIVKTFDTRIADLGLVGDALAKASVAITQRERERELLTNELNHRVKNTLATVQSLAMNTLKDVPLDRARDAFTARLLALASIHDVLTTQNWAGAELHDIVGSLRRGFGSERHVFANGPRIWLRPNAAMAMSLTLNELATNAAKYGALSVGEGRIRIAWEVGEGQEENLLVLDWQEDGGPPVKQPRRRGFGLRLIEASLAGFDGGKAEVAFEADGLRCRICVPAPEFTMLPVGSPRP